jgi:four helix bundle protein
MRRAAVSIGSNIAEGCGREGDRALVSFLQIAFGSASELEFQVELSVDLEFLAEGASAPLLAEIRQVMKMLAGLIVSLRKSLESESRKRPPR